MKIYYPTKHKDVEKLVNVFWKNKTILFSVRKAHPVRVSKLIDFMAGVTFAFGGDVELLDPVKKLYRLRYSVNPHFFMGHCFKKIKMNAEPLDYSEVWYSYKDSDKKKYPNYPPLHAFDLDDHLDLLCIGMN